MRADDRMQRSRVLYERALFEGDASALGEAGRELDAVEADLALARGRLIHGRFLQRQNDKLEQSTGDPRELALFERAAQLYRELGDGCGEAEALFWIGCCHQVVQHDDAAAVPVLERSLKLASTAGDKKTMAEALRHLGIAEHRAGRLDAARQRLEESTRLRRELGLQAGVASNMVGLIYIAAGQGRRDDALVLIREASALAQASGAHSIAAGRGSERRRRRTPVGTCSLRS